MIDFILNKFSLIRKKRALIISKAFIEYIIIYSQDCVLEDFGIKPEDDYLAEQLKEYEEFFNICNKDIETIKKSCSIGVKRTKNKDEYSFYFDQ